VLFAPAGSETVARLQAATLPSAAPMLNERIAAGHQRVLDQLRTRTDVLSGTDEPGAPVLLLTTVDEVVADPEALLTECFGPTALVVTYRDEAELVRVARLLEGQLTATVVAEDDDDTVPALLAVLARKAGRLLWNQWPTGVSVTYAQQHGGPYPATTAPGTTSVGTAALTRFVRPLAWQGFPQQLLPEELRDTPSSPVVQRVDGRIAGRAEEEHA
jgi:NADP-dependent aldehyde dehydrogenase